LHFTAGRVAVHLPSAAQSLSAVIGADSNGDDRGYRERGSFVLSVEANGTDLYHSDILREGMAGVPINVNLAGAKDFTLELKPAGKKNPWDSPTWDQADWAEARVTLADGSTLWLSDLPIGPPRDPYAVGPPFAFRYGNRPSSELLKTWELQRSERRLDANRTEQVLTYRDPKTRLVVRCVAVVYDDFPTVEWTVYFKNEGTEDTPILEKIQALDAAVRARPGGRIPAAPLAGQLHYPNRLPAPGDPAGATRGRENNLRERPYDVQKSHLFQRRVARTRGNYRPGLARRLGDAVYPG
jgi:alpha-galactosidase